MQTNINPTSELPEVKQEPIIYELANVGELISLRAEEKTGNSWYLMQAGHCWSAGKQFLRYAPVRPLKVLYVDCDLNNAQAGFRFRAIERCMQYKAGHLDYISLRNDIKDWDLLARVLTPQYDLYILDGTHWFGRQYEIVTYLRNTGKTILCSEVFRHTSIDKRLLFGFSPFDTTITILPHWLENYKVLEVSTRNHVKRNKSTLVCAENLIEVVDHVKPKIRERYKRYASIAEVYLRALNTLQQSVKDNWVKALGKEIGTSDFRNTVDWMLKHELVYCKVGRYYISKRGMAMLDCPEYDPCMRTVEEASTEMDFKEDNAIIDRFGPIEKFYPVPIKLNVLNVSNELPGTTV